MTQQTAKMVVLDLPVGSLITKDYDQYMIVDDGVKVEFPVGTALKITPVSPEEMLLMADDVRPENVRILRGGYRLDLDVGTKLKYIKLNADVILKDKQTFVLTYETKVSVPKGTPLLMACVEFIKNDNAPMYLSCKIEAGDFLGALMKQKR